jgi:membrane-associated phospholipid phosphatase
MSTSASSTLASRTSRHPAAQGLAVAVAGYVVLAALMVGIGALVKSAADAEPNRWLAARRTETWDDLTGIGSTMADTLTVVLITAVIAGALLLVKGWRPPVLLVSALLLEVTVFLTAALLVDRERPPVIKLDEVPPTSSFPSGHTAAAVALYVTLALIVTANVRSTLVRVLIWTVAVLVPIAVGASRMYRGLHYVSDVVAGAALGIACVVVATIVVRVASSSAEEDR